MKRGALAGLVALAAIAACDYRACLAQSEIFAGFRANLVDECCTCLSTRGTRHPGAACAETFLDVDGGIVILADAGPFIPLQAPDLGDDNDDTVDADEVPCMCGDDLAQCKKAFTEGDSIVITGSCISQGAGLFVQAPCESECEGVITFDPLTTGP